MLVLLCWSFSYIKWGVIIWFHLNPRNFNPRNFQFSVGFSFETLFPLPPSVTTFISKDVEFYCASFDIYEKFAGACPPTQTPTQKLKSWFSMSSSQGIASSLISFEMIFRVLQSELFRFKFKSLSSKIVKIPEFNLVMGKGSLWSRFSSAVFEFRELSTFQILTSLKLQVQYSIPSFSRGFRLFIICEFKWAFDGYGPHIMGWHCYLFHRGYKIYRNNGAWHIGDEYTGYATKYVTRLLRPISIDSGSFDLW